MAGPRSFRVVLQTPEGSAVVECLGEEAVWLAAARAGVRLPAICQQGRCLTCAARLRQGEVDQSSAETYFSEDREAGFVLLCTARPRSSLVLETHQEEAMRSHRRAKGLPAPY